MCKAAAVSVGLLESFHICQSIPAAARLPRPEVVAFPGSRDRLRGVQKPTTTAAVVPGSSYHGIEEVRCLIVFGHWAQDQRVLTASPSLY